MVATSNKRLTVIFITIVMILMVPLIAMQFNESVNWSLSDFVIAGLLLTITGSAIELVLRKVKTLKYRISICALLLTLLALVWAELAVGIFGSPFAGS